ncbi:polysaccharide deacetylase family protein [Lentibacillus sp. CBA3610]|uniref:polysaccharide deacetylase family protein n=1 Tax=Lentibacillus sp. CBA3610 TaxID=2518176 RepID=UPI0015991431|nr:polysaccharide deacetylase family protein [Lentibacillus sp. CBA3610]QKY68917.1 polysaccharide deacetylase family protein [Lentibacillus sp. CBA3610]
MKNIIWVLFAAALLMTACADETTDVEKTEEDTTEQEKTEESTADTSDAKQNESEDEEKASGQSDKGETVQENISEPEYKIDENDSSVVPISEKGNEKAVLLTIDDVPDGHALNMAKTLKDLDAGAIFFVNGHFLETSEDKETVQQIHDMGFAIGNHTYNHELLPDLSTEEQEEEIVSLSDTIEDIIGERPQFFRAPHGANTDFTKQLVEDEGMVLMNWTYGYDYFEPYMDAEKLTEAMVTGKGPEADVPHSLLKPGANLLMHDREWTAEALEDIVIGLRDKGYEIVDPELIQTVN